MAVKQPHERCNCGDPAIADGLCDFHYGWTRGEENMRREIDGGCPPETLTTRFEYMHICADMEARIGVLEGLLRETGTHLGDYVWGHPWPPKKQPAEMIALMERVQMAFENQFVVGHYYPLGKLPVGSYVDGLGHGGTTIVHPRDVERNVTTIVKLAQLPRNP